MNANAKVTITLTLEFDTGAWGPECTISQLRDQARASAESMADRAVLTLRDLKGARVVDRKVGPVHAVLLPEKS